ncbi:MAG: hypothetical protein Q9163_000143 [Psora crenata]
MIEGKDGASSSEESRRSSTSGHDSEEETAIESLVAGRVKRATAGNRLSALVDKEQDDEIGLLFAEDEEAEDESFDEEEEDASDANMGGSSSDEEDQEPTKGNDDLAGEKELQRQARLEKKKRKAKDLAKMPGMARKKVKIDATAVRTTTAAQPRAKKKSERVSWVATAADTPTRISSRKQTVQNRAVVHQRLVNSEKQRVKVMRQMFEAQKRKDAMKPKALTQAQRLEEAAKTERKNAKSLNRWEESEKKRAAEQKAKLEALHNRQLSGPIVTSWSGIVRWANGKIEQLGVKAIREAGHREESIQKSEDSKLAGFFRDDGQHLGHDIAPSHDGLPQQNENTGQQLPYMAYPHHLYAQPPPFAAPQGPHGFLDGIHAYAALPAPPQRADSTGTADGTLGPPATPAWAPSTIRFRQLPQAPVGKERGFEYTSRNLLALKNVDANTQRLPEMQNSILIRKRGIKGQSKFVSHLDGTLTLKRGRNCAEPVPQLCAITGQPARFRDPKSGLAYANQYAYKEIQRLMDGGSRWSNLLDCYVGPTHTVARGVPERFWKRG